MTEHVLFFDIDGTMLSTGGAGLLYCFAVN